MNAGDRRSGGSAAGTLPRYRLVVAYDGAGFHGFQLQAPGLDTVAWRLEEALARLCPEGAADERVVVEGASRTDAGVHARGQVCAFSSRMTVPLDRLPVALNSLLPPGIVVLRADSVTPDFDPRRARSKTYCYRIWRSRLPSPFWRDRALHVVHELDLEACRAALGPLAGEHDFAAFRDAGSSARTTVRKLSRAELQVRPLPPDWPEPGELVSLWFEGNGFLYHMVRIIVGTLLEVGLGRLPALITRQALASGKRVALGPTAPACGLWLEKVVYAEEATDGGRGTAWGDREKAGGEHRPSGAEGPESLASSEVEGFCFP